MTAGAGGPVAVVDVGSNTVRLLVASCTADHGLIAMREERSHLRLGEEIERTGRLSRAKVQETAACAGRYAASAEALGAHAVCVAVTAPGRQGANADELIRALDAATGTNASVLSPEEEGRYAYLGAIATASRLPRPLAVCDVGGGSTELVVGTGAEPSWSRSLDIGSLRLTARHMPDDPPSEEQLRRAREAVAALLPETAPPPVAAALATGGTARALRKLVGRTLGGRQLVRALGLVVCYRSSDLAARYGVDPLRARTLPAGALILHEVGMRIRPPFLVSHGGIREGLAASLLGWFGEEHEPQPERHTTGTVR